MQTQCAQALDPRRDVFMLRKTKCFENGKQACVLQTFTKEYWETQS